MLVLGIDTATSWGATALYEGQAGGNGEIIFEITFKTGKGGGEYLFAMLDSIMKKAGRSFKEIDLIAAGTGPGSYTGIRVGLAAVKGLAAGLQKPVQGINTLRIIAENARFAACDYVVAAIDARNEQIYAAFFKKTGAGLEELAGPRFTGVREFAAGLTNFGPVIVCGDGGKIYRDIWDLYGIKPGPNDWDRPSAGKLAQLAVNQWNPDSWTDLAELKAYYLRRVEAEIRLEEKLHAINHQSDEA